MLRTNNLLLVPVIASVLSACGGGTASSAAPASTAPTVSLVANPASVANGASSTLTWSSTNATSCTAVSGWSGAKATSGSQSTGALTASSSYSLTCSGSGSSSGSASATVTVAGTPPPPPPGSQNFSTRCAQPGVIRCVDFDSASSIAGTYGSNSGITTGAATPTIDTSVKASGTGSLKFTIPSLSPADSSGSYFTNFSSDLSVQFGENQEFYIQWRQRFSPELLSAVYQSGGGWKQSIIGTGDKPGCAASNTTNCYASCTDLTVVTQNVSKRGFPQMYNSCSGSTSHGAFWPLDEPFGSDFKLQNARPSPYCLYSQVLAGTPFPPNGNCFGYFPNEWMTFQVKITTGPRFIDEWISSNVTMWIARENQPSQLVIDRLWNLTAGSAVEDQKFGKIWLLPYHTNKSPTEFHPEAYTWFDELIISRLQIADPAP